MVGRLAGTYCPPLLPTDVVAVARAASDRSSGDEIALVEVLARAALDAAVAALDGDLAHEGPRP